MPPFDPLLSQDTEAPPLTPRDLLWSLGLGVGLATLAFLSGGVWTGAAG